jgi:hypothetical protein
MLVIGMSHGLGEDWWNVVTDEGSGREVARNLYAGPVDPGCGGEGVEFQSAMTRIDTLWVELYGLKAKRQRRKMSIFKPR